MPTRYPTQGPSAPNVSSHVVDALIPIFDSSPGADHAVALTHLTVLAHHELGNDEHREPLGPGFAALATGQHQVDDVVGVVTFAGRDEAFHAFDVIDAGLLIDRDGLGGPGPDIGARIGFGEHHRAAPGVGQHRLDEVLDLLGGTLFGHHVRHQRADDEEEGCRVAADEQLLGGPAQGRRRTDAAELRRAPEVVPALLVVGPDRLLDAFRQGDFAVDELDRRPVALLEAGGEVLDGESARPR